MNEKVSKIGDNRLVLHKLFAIFNCICICFIGSDETERVSEYHLHNSAAIAYLSIILLQQDLLNIFPQINSTIISFYFFFC